MGEPSAVQPEIVARFEESLSRCFANDRFAEAFYERLLDSSEVVREKFSSTNFAKQKKVIESSLYLMARAALGMSDGLSHLESISLSHSRKGLDISPSLYKLWLETLLSTAREFDSDFDETIEMAWRLSLAGGINAMVAVYRREETIPPARRKSP